MLEKTSAHCYIIKGYPQTYSLQVYPVYPVFSLSLSTSACVSACAFARDLHVHPECIPDDPQINVTASENQPSSYRFTQVNQRNLWTILDFPDSS